MKTFILIVSILLLVSITFVFGVNNDQLITINYLIAQNELRLSSLLAIVLAIGFILASLLFSTVLIKQKVSLKILQAKLKKALNEPNQ